MLRDAGLVTVRADGTRRIYSLDRAGVDAARTWLAGLVDPLAPFTQPLDALATEGRLVVIGMQGGTKGELDLGKLLRKRGAVIATALRSRPVEGKSAICAAVVEHVWPLVADGTVRPIIGARVPMAEAGRAHALMESGESSGKILLTVS